MSYAQCSKENAHMLRKCIYNRPVHDRRRIVNESLRDLVPFFCKPLNERPQVAHIVIGLSA